LFYVLGTLGATQLPVVSSAPLKSLEQLGTKFKFFIIPILPVFQIGRQMRPTESLRDFRMSVIILVGVLVAILVGILNPMGYFGPLSSRVRGLSIRHTHTGNPLMDSVAEHQATQDGMYWQFLFYCSFGCSQSFMETFRSKIFLVCVCRGGTLF